MHLVTGHIGQGIILFKISTSKKISFKSREQKGCFYRMSKKQNSSKKENWTPKYIEVTMLMPTIKWPQMILKMPRMPIRKKWALQELIQLSKIHVDLTMFSIYAKIGTIQVIVPLVTVACIFTIGPTIRQVGNLKNNSSNSKDRDGKESTTLN